MAINFDQDRSGLLGIDTGVDYDKMAFNPGSLKDTLIKNMYNIEKETGFSNPQLDKLKQEDMKQFKEKGTPLSLPSDAYTAMGIANYDELFGPKTITDAFGIDRTVPALNRPKDLYTGKFNVNDINAMNTGVINSNSFRSLLSPETPAYEMIGGVPVAIGDVLGRQMALEKSNYYEAPKKGLNLNFARTALGLLTGNPLVSLIGRGIGSLSGLSDKMQSTDFGRSKTLAEYVQKVRERKQAEKARELNKEVYERADRLGFTNERGGFSTDKADDAGTSLGSGQFSPETSRGRAGY